MSIATVPAENTMLYDTVLHALNEGASPDLQRDIAVIPP